MYKIRLVNRGINSRRLRKINSATDLVGEGVMVSDGTNTEKAEVEAVKVNSDDSVVIDLSNGDQVNLEPEEAQELVETGAIAQDDAEVELEDPEAEEVAASRKDNGMEVRRRVRRGKCDDVVAPEVETIVEEPKEFTVSRDVVDENGDVDAVVTTKVDAANYDDAVDKVKMIDSRRGRNCRHYRIRNSKNSEVEVEVEEQKTNEDPEPEEVSPEVNCGMKEFKIQRNCGNGKRKIASVTAPSLEEAMDAVKAKDAKDGIQADGYAELAEELPKVDPKINSDVEVEDPKPAEDPKPEEDEERKENSFKGVSDYVKRAYGINL